MPRFIHTADWQIGRQYSRFDAQDAAALAQARFDAVARIAQLAHEHAVDAVLVAGDVFDAQAVADRSIRRLFEAMRGYAGPWVLLPGNHDAALAESVWQRARRLQAVPQQVHLALAPEAVLLAAQGLAVLPAPLTQRHTHDDLTAWFDHAATPEGLLRVGLAHGSVQGLLAEDIDAPNPIAPDRAERARLDYLALGDWHGCKQVDARTWYSGTPEPDRFKDNGSGQALLVEIDAPGAIPRVTPLPVARHVWRQWQCALEVPSDVEALIARLQGLGGPDVLDLQLSGQLDLASQQRLRDALSVAEARLRSLQCDWGGVRLQPTPDDLAALHADGYVGAVIEELRGLQALTDADKAEAARDALGILAGLLREQHNRTAEGAA